MNKQQLAGKIWESANKMRSRIEANEYKDYILGFIFYKFLSETEFRFIIQDGMEESDLADELIEEDSELVGYLQSNVGYFIAYQHLFSTWINSGSDFNISDVRDALSAFERLIHPRYKKSLTAFLTLYKQAFLNLAIVQHPRQKLSVTLFTSSMIFQWMGSRTMTFWGSFTSI